MPPNEAETRACLINPRLEAAGWGGDRNSTRFRPIAIRHRPPLLLHVQRRLGKSSLLNNLGQLLSSAIIPLFVDLQGPSSRASDHTAFPYSVARGMSNTAAWQRDQRAGSAHRLRAGGRSASSHRATSQGLFRFTSSTPAR
jgi:hypothetical protein